MIKKIFLYFNTIRYLKTKQILYHIYYRYKFYHYNSRTIIEKNIINSNLKFNTDKNSKNNLKIYNNKLIFSFLNLNKSFNRSINWNYNAHGRLWNYNLRYFDFLFDSGINVDQKLDIIIDFNKNLKESKVKLEPYTTSKRLINCIKFICVNDFNLNSSKMNDIIQSLYSQYLFLINNIEYHILGNHLLENAFALYTSSLFFNDMKVKKNMQKLILDQLVEQTCDDGAHYELSPMYHQIIFYRVLQSYKISDDISFKNALSPFIQSMLNWLYTITYNDGFIPHFNDSTNNIALDSYSLFKIAERLDFYPKKTILSKSGYRKYVNSKFEFVIDVHGISPSYQPGHSHSDHLSFEMKYLNEPIVVDPGISTYENSDRRLWERSSVSHNTITINNSNQSDIWSSFRVASRSKVVVNKDLQNNVMATCIYKANNDKIIHSREVLIKNKMIRIIDKVNSVHTNNLARFYLHPNVSVKILSKNKFELNKKLIIEFKNSLDTSVFNYKFNNEFNFQTDSLYIQAVLSDNLETNIIAI